MTRNRFLPLYVGTALQGFMLWVPVEKLFMSEVGFTPATVGLMAIAYAAMVPLMEIPSGILADRWSRRGVLIVAGLALSVNALVGGLSDSVPMYILSTLPLGVYFAMYTGTMDSVVYDTVLEETGDSEQFERRLGRVRFVESATLVGSALAGGVIAGLTSTRLTYFLTVPFGLLAAVALLRFREPVLHKSDAPESLRGQIALTWRTLLSGGKLVPIVVLAVLTSVIVSVIFEFGPLWLLALSASAIVFGPFWAAMVSTIGLGGLLAGRLQLERARVLLATVATMTAASLALVTSRNLVVITIAQVTLALLLAVVSIHVTKLLHDSVPSTVRSGVASGVSAFSWLAFLPIAATFGLVGERLGIYAAGWTIVAAVVAASAVLVKVVTARRAPRVPLPTDDGALPALELVGAR